MGRSPKIHIAFAFVVLVDDKVIAKGEVVIVDGNFGIQITDIGTKRDRLEQLRG